MNFIKRMIAALRGMPEKPAILPAPKQVRTVRRPCRACKPSGWFPKRKRVRKLQRRARKIERRNRKGKRE